MGRRWKTEDQNDSKARLVREICSLSSSFGRPCAHRRPRCPNFVDWYLILRIDADAGVDLVRRRYRHLALLLHPDKNKHPQAEVAFKLVSQAYACLSDEERRRTFDSERRDNACRECMISRPDIKAGSPPGRTSGDDVEGPSVVAAPRARVNITNQSILRELEEFRSRIREDARVIENCLRARQALARAGQPAALSPVFDPSDRLLYPDYPHRRVVEPVEIWYDHAAGRYAARRGSQGSHRGSPVYDGHRSVGACM